MKQKCECPSKGNVSSGILYEVCKEQAQLIFDEEFSR